VDQFKYLGTILTEDNQITKEIEVRIQAGNKCFFSLANLLGAGSLSKELKKQLYTTLIRPIVTYGAKIHLLELDSLYQKSNIVETIRTKRLKWTGHAWKNQNPLFRTVLEKNLTGKRSIGRSRMRWEDVVKNDVEELGGGNDWKMRAANRDGWKAGCILGLS
jgi:hypothetical protein